MSSYAWCSASKTSNATPSSSLIKKSASCSRQGNTKEEVLSCKKATTSRFMLVASTKLWLDQVKNLYKPIQNHMILIDFVSMKTGGFYFKAVLTKFSSALLGKTDVNSQRESGFFQENRLVRRARTSTSSWRWPTRTRRWRSASTRPRTGGCADRCQRSPSPGRSQISFWVGHNSGQPLARRISPSLSTIMVKNSHKLPNLDRMTTYYVRLQASGSSSWMASKIQFG